MNSIREDLPSTTASTTGAVPDHQEAEVKGAGAPVSAAQIGAALAATDSAGDCVALAGEAEKIGDAHLKRECLGRAIGLDRNCQAALLMLAAESLDDDDAAGTFALLEETARAGLLPENVTELHAAMLGQVEDDPRLEDYLRAIGRRGDGPAEEPRSIVLVTNLFPPQELGGYGRMMWEFAHGLIARGHRVQVLTADTTEFGQPPTPDEVAMEAHVRRTLKLLGTWRGGRPVLLADRAEAQRRLRDNAARLRTAVVKAGADLVLAGNLDFLGVSVLQAALQARIPVLHALANAAPGYAPAEQPAEAHYWVAPCSDWNGEVFAQAGFTPARRETLYPGARMDRFFRLFLPDVRRLRLCYASLVLPYKGAGTLVQALGRLHRAGVEFTAEIAGAAPDAAYLETLRAQVRRDGLEERVKFTGFLDRRGLAALFARSNVLVFPSEFQEPFGISQIEALAAGLVVVSSGTGGAKEIIRAGVDGLLFAAGDSADLAAKLQGLAGDPGLMQRLQRSGQARAAAFSVDRAVRKIETLAGEMRTALTTEDLSLPELDGVGAGAAAVA